MSWERIEFFSTNSLVEKYVKCFSRFLSRPAFVRQEYLLLSLSRGQNGSEKEAFNEVEFRETICRKDRRLTDKNAKKRERERDEFSRFIENSANAKRRRAFSRWFFSQTVAGRFWSPISLFRVSLERAYRIGSSIRCNSIKYKTSTRLVQFYAYQDAKLHTKRKIEIVEILN